jgi:hypothetical protein
MIVDPFSLVALIHDLIEDYSEERIIVIEPLGDVENEPTYRDLKSKGHMIEWRHKDRLKALSRAGWRPVIKRDSWKRPYIFVDRKRELILVSKSQ